MSSTIKERFESAIGERYEQNDAFLSSAAGASLADIQKFQQRYERNLYGRAGLSLERLEVTIPPAAGDDMDSILRIAMVSSHIDGTRKGEERGTYIDGKEVNLKYINDRRWRLMRPADTYREDVWRKRRAEEVNRALQRRPHVVCLPEFAFPPPTERIDHTGYSERSNYGRLFAQFEDEVMRELNSYNGNHDCPIHPFMFLGSYHCPDDHFNIGVIYPNGEHKAAVTTEVYRPDDLVSDDDPNLAEPSRTIKLRPPLLYRKRYPASRAGEVARTPSRIQFNTYNYKETRIAVLICSDVLDLNQFMNMVRINNARESRYPIDLILVPAYNMSSILKSICRELSFAAATAVAYVNANPGWCNDFPESELFVCGHDAQELKELSGEHSPVVIGDYSDPLPDDGRLRVIELDRKAMNALKHHFRRIHAQGTSSSRVTEYDI